MSGYTDLTKLENTRNCLRRIARHDELQFSKDSIVNVMEKFVKTVNVMDETILVPCRLMDRQVGDSTDIIPTPGKDVTSNQHTFVPNANGKRNPVKSKNVHEFLNSSELFNLYNMLNALKNDLLWTGKDDSEDLDEKQITMENQEVNTEIISTNSATTKGHTRRPSTASMASIASVSQMSDSESDISQENDSGVESECNKTGSGSDSTSSSSEDGHMQSKKLNNADKATELAKRCRRHLNGLYHCLEQMTEAANYLTTRYQNDIGGPV